MIRARPAALVLDDEGAFADSIAPLLPIAFRLAYGMLGSREDAEDAVQDAAAKAWRKRSQFKAGSDAKPWLLAIVANECRMQRRRTRPSLLGWVPVQPEAAEPSGPEVDEVERLRGALAGLDRKHRLVLVLRFYLDLSSEEMGRTLGISAAAARVRVHRALERLRPLITVSEETGNG